MIRSAYGSSVNPLLQLVPVSICVAGLLLFSLPARAQRHVLQTRIAAPAKAQPVGHLPATRRLNLSLTLPLRNQEQLNSLLHQLYDPTSPQYRQFLSLQQFSEQFGPTTEDYDKVIEFAKKFGLTVTNTTANRLVLDVNGTVAQIEQTFHVTMQLFQHPTENRTFHAPDTEPSVDEGVPIQGVNGLNNFAPPRPVGLKRLAAGDIKRGNQTGSGPDGFFLGSDMRAAYAPGTALTGAGQAVGLFEFGPYNLSDVQAYFSFVNQPLNVPIVNVLIDGVNGICGAGCDDGEEVIDIQQAISMAPGLSAVIVYEGNNDTDMFNRMATDNVAKQLSCSFGWLPADPSSDEPIFEEFAAQGQNLFIASGDGGAYFGNPTDCQNFSNLNGCVFYPADDPDITAAGGTDLTTASAGGPWESETAWIGSGGGFSTNDLTIPSYQVPVISATNQGSTTLRNIPDVAAEANTDNFFCANGGCFIGVGGTSLSAPRWAGFLALANEQANGIPIGFLNPMIYSLGQGASYNLDFHDITNGNNFNSGSPDLFSDTVGYDLVTGWGSPNGSGLLNALGPAATGPNFSMAASPDKVSVTQGNTGTGTITVSPANGFAGTVNLSVTALGSPVGVTASVSPTSVSTTGSATLSISTTGSTPGGNFPIVVTGTSGGLTHTAYVTLAVPGFMILAPPNVFLNQDASTTSTITITDVNGFEGDVKLKVAGLPKGVIAHFMPPNTATTSKLEFLALPLAETGFASVTITGTSGKITQTATINLAVSAAIGNFGLGTQANLSDAFNINGIYTDGSTYSTGGLDGGGFSYSANLLTASRVLDLTLFRFGPANQLDAISGTGQTVTLPEGHFLDLLLLGTGVQGSQVSQPVTVTYIDGTSTQFVQSFSDWFSPQSFPNEYEAVAMPYRNYADGSEDQRTFNLYAYRFRLNPAKRVKSVTFPNNPYVVVLAATLLRD
jgi:subtilase family serine protease